MYKIDKTCFSQNQNNLKNTFNIQKLKFFLYSNFVYYHKYKRRIKKKKKIVYLVITIIICFIFVLIETQYIIL